MTFTARRWQEQHTSRTAIVSVSTRSSLLHLVPTATCLSSNQACAAHGQWLSFDTKTTVFSSAVDTCSCEAEKAL